MIKPIVAYGNPVLRKVAVDIDKDYPDFQTVITNLYDTLKSSEGVGLAAPQIGLSIRVFVVDANGFAEDYPDAKGFVRTFINPQIIETKGKEWMFNEGCLSFPGIFEDVSRPSDVTIRYLDEQFVEHTETFTGICARIIQHEYDHLDGKCFIDRLNPLKRKMLSGKLNNILKGKVTTRYKIKFAKI
ncbi:MAG: peptide deformylase [Bacteroidales bacterium]|jgi:peptide deformylase|nr:peptide deformylase [Bacteroidales bacterium]